MFIKHLPKPKYRKNAAMIKINISLYFRYLEYVIFKIKCVSRRILNI